MKRLSLSSLLIAGLIVASLPTAHAADDADAARLTQRLQQLDGNPALAGMASYERLQAQQAIARLAEARSRDRANAVYVADRRVEIAEVAVRVEQGGREVDRLERERSELLVEASRREADRARREAEHLRIQTQIQAEEAERLRLTAEQEAAARQQAEGVLNDVAGKQAAKLRAARKRQAELAKREAELMSGSAAASDKASKPAKPKK